LQEVETKVAQINRRLDSANSQQQAEDLSRIRDDLRGVRGDIEKLRFDIDSRERSSKDLIADLDRRIRILEGGGGGGAAVPPVGGYVPPPSNGLGGPGTVPTNTPGTIAPAGMNRAAVATPEEERAYLGTFDLLKNGKYDDAIRGFRGILDQWPQGRYADNSWYWMGEAQFTKHDFSGGASSFQSLVDKFPQSAKMSDGLYKLGLCQIELKRNSEAKANLQRILREYPTSNAAKLAKQKLDQFGG
jgi:tol-pal system protein YbgF